MPFSQRRGGDPGCGVLQQTGRGTRSTAGAGGWGRYRVALVLSASVLMAVPVAGLPGAGPSAPGATWASGQPPQLSSPVSAEPASGLLPVYGPAGDPGPASSSTRAAPLGIADPGSGPSAGGYATAGLLGRVDLSSISTFNASLGPAAGMVSFQLNAFLEFESNGTSFVYWAQDVLELDTNTSSVFFEDNLWNASSPSLSSLNNGSITGNGTVQTSPSGDYYVTEASASLPGATARLSLPTTVMLEMNSSRDGSNHPVIRFLFDDGFGPTVFDTVSFLLAGSLSVFPGFVVSSHLQGPSCPRCYGDAELVAGGPYSGYQTAVTGPTDVLLELLEWNGHNFASVPEASGYGVATAEGLTSGSVIPSVAPGGVPAARLTQGPLALTSLWTSADVASLEISVLTPPGRGVLDLNGSSIPFGNGSVVVVLTPGAYSANLTSGGQWFLFDPVNLTGGDVATLEVGGIAVVFAPEGLPRTTVWSVTLGNRTLRGTGEITFGSSLGTFDFTVLPLPGYTADPVRGSVTVTGSAVGLVVHWQPKPLTVLEEAVALLELPVGPVPLYVVLAGLTALGVFSGVWGRRRRRRRQKFRRWERELRGESYDP